MKIHWFTFVLATLYALFMYPRPTFAAGNVYVNSYASTNVTTSAYVQLIASTPANASEVQVCDTSGHIIKIALGAAGSEAPAFVNQVSGCTAVRLFIPQGSRVSLEAVDASATTGYMALSLVQ